MHRAVSLYIRLITVIFLCHAFLPRLSWAEGLSFRTDQKYTYSNSETKILATGQTIDTDFYRYDQLYDLEVSKAIYPYLQVDAGAIYELKKSKFTAGDLDTETTEKILRPFASLNLNNPLYKAGITYRKRRREFEITDVPDIRADRDEINAVLGMTPGKGFPRWTARFSQVHTYDDPESVDEIEKRFNLDSDYTLWQSLRFDYNFSYEEKDNRIADFTTDRYTHFGKIGYARNFLSDRLLMSTEYRVNYEVFKFPADATVESLLPRSAGLSSLDNTPQDGPALGINTALIDGNLIASAGINIGTNGDQATLVNIGLDLGLTADVDIIRLWVDRRLSAIVVNQFSWAIYTSPNNTDQSTWTLAATVSPATFGAFDNRFEISFPAVNTRFIKVVTGALAPTDPGAIDFPDIFVTEMQALVTGTEQDDSEQTTLDQNYSLNLLGKLSSKTNLGYNLSYRSRDEDPSSDKRTELINGLFLKHRFSDILIGNANGQRTDTSDVDEDIVTYDYGVSLKAQWLETLDQSLTLSGTHEKLDQGKNYTNSIFLRNNAALYQGWSMYADLGYSWQETVDDLRYNTKTLKTGTSIQPNAKLNFDAYYSYRLFEQSSSDGGSSDETEWDAQAFYNPFTNLSILARLNYLDRGQGSQTYQNYSANWSPFPDGDLQFFFVYSETLRSPGDRRDTTIGPGMKWTIGRHIFIDTSYSYTKSETFTQEIESNLVNANLRLVF
jgi:hypothetical protein